MMMRCQNDDEGDMVMQTMNGEDNGEDEDDYDDGVKMKMTRMRLKTMMSSRNDDEMNGKCEDEDDEDGDAEYGGRLKVGEGDAGMMMTGCETVR